MLKRDKISNRCQDGPVLILDTAMWSVESAISRQTFQERGKQYYGVEDTDSLYVTV